MTTPENEITPLPGEPGIPSVSAVRNGGHSRKGLVSLALFALSLVAVAAFAVQRLTAKENTSSADEGKRHHQQPAAASNSPRRLDLQQPAPGVVKAVNPAVHTPHIPELEPGPLEASPIPLRRAGPANPSSGGATQLPPEDAPILLVSSRPEALSGRTGPASQSPAMPMSEAPRNTDSVDALDATTRNLENYQKRLERLLDAMTQSTALGGRDGSATPSSVEPAKAAAPAWVPPPLAIAPATVAAQSGSGLFGGQLSGSATPRTAASYLGNRSLTLPKGTTFTCALKTKVVSATSGFVGCQVQRHVYSDDGKVLLVERGSHLDGEYRITSVKPGTVRIPVLWTRIRTPLGVTVDIDSPGTGALGESGVDGYVDNRWVERIGAAMLLSLIDDSVKLVIQNQANDASNGTVVLPSTTANTSKLAEKVLDSTINIPPLIYQNQGGIVGIYVARDVDFSTVYELKPVAR